MKIISLNTWMGIVREPLLDFFEKNKDTDLFCLQEIYKDAGRRPQHPEYKVELELFERIQERLIDTHIGYFRACVEDRYGLAMFVRKDIHVFEEGSIFIYENKDWKDDGSDRGNHSRNMQYMHIEINDRPLFIANVHGLWRGGAGKADMPDRIEQSKRIVNFISKYDDPKIIVGDFNLDPDTESLAIVEKGMRSLIREYGIKSTRTSFYKKDGKFADYALVSPDVKVIDFRVLPDEVSDHRALYLEVK